MTEPKRPKTYKPPFTRTRESNRFTGGRSLYVSSTLPGGSVSQNNFARGEKSWMVDVVTPGFRELSNAGKVIISPMQSSHQSKTSVAKSLGSGYFGTNPASYWRYDDGPDTVWCMGLTNADSLLGSVPAVHSGSDMVNVEVEASTKCLSNRNRGSTNMWENLAEVDKTLGMLWSPLRSWFRFERKARVASLGLSAANAWLMYRYGIKPLVSSVTDVMGALDKVADTVGDERQTIRGKATSTMEWRGEASRSDSSTFTFRKSITETVHVRAMSLETVVSSYQKAYGLGSKDLLTLPWELIPYSFVLDWFVNVGDYIGALADAFYPGNLGSCLVTEVVQSAVWESISHTGTSMVKVTSPLLAVVREDCVTKYRTVGLRNPGLVVKANFRLDNATRIGDSLGLVAQQIASRFRR